MKSYDRPVRVCDNCHNLFSPNGSSTDNSKGISHGKEAIGSSGVPAQDSTHPPDPPVLYQCYKLLPGDLMYNQNVRREFYYERAPNTALCLSLADLLLSKRQAAGVILDCCHTVSAQLVPDSLGRINEELDHHFVIGWVLIWRVYCSSANFGQR